MKKRKRSSYKKKRDAFTHRPIRDRFYTKDDVFVSRMASILMVPKGKVPWIFSQRPITTIRLNSLMGDVEETKKELLGRGYELEEIPWSENTYFVMNKDKAEVSQTELYDDGKYYIQNLSSILATLILDPKKNEKILDMCAAPGSKTTHIADMVSNNANIIANDIDMNRISDLQSVVDQFGAKAKVTLSDGKEFGQKYPVYFDKVLLDAPCSGEGLIYFKGPKPLRFWSMDKVKRSVFIQKELVISAFKTLKHGSYMVYSTCTLEPEENEGVLTHLLKTFPNAKVEKIELKDEIVKSMPELEDFIKPGIRKWSGNVYDKQVKNAIRIVPNKMMMGFFIAKISKE
ncbi:TPA: RsmB/NOP family class I SAM-dependent RNA methyltransferase [Candidatus Dojkabacteria bacterium]|uniref:RsmB/NOP family class I SAM-dependent RNA methyltransferase n=1 Tax=Candidatus Dojkabacteria bacterium TaxID=2099670 RepID=A0A832RCQ3_9BACT|nr:RsmB/NOP family class I SAM-dependent RNA methyltransferase [Candidatus Dojkabacteria bacterium]